MRARHWLLIVVLACCAASATPAHGASARSQQAAVVARDGAVTLSASDDKDDEDDAGALCVTIRSPRGERTSCGQSRRGVVSVPEEDAGSRHVGAAVPQLATRVELRRAGRLVATAPTVAGAAYTGKSAGSVRFALVRVPAGAPTDGLRVHALDGAGTLVAVLASFDGERIFDRRRVLSGRSGRVRWSIVSHRSSRLAPTVFDLAHETIARCLVVRVRGEQEHLGDSCESEIPLDGLALFGDAIPQAAAEDRCAPRFRLVHGAVAPDVRRVTVVLGDGRRQAARMAAGTGSGQLTYALGVRAGVAVRHVLLQLRSGRTRVVQVAAAPLAVACATGDSDSILPFGEGAGQLVQPFAGVPALTPPGPVATLPGSPPVRLADGPADTLCITLGDQPFDALGCALVAPDLDELLGTLDSYTDPGAFALVVPASVATVRIAGPGGAGTRDVPTLPVAPYSGRYAGHVRFASTTISGYRELTRITLLDGAGKVLHSERDSSGGPPTGTARISPARRIAGRAGSASLWQTTVRLAGQQLRCLSLTPGRRPAADANCQITRSGVAVLLHAACTTRRLTVAIAAAANTRVLADTGAATSRRVTLRGGAGLLTLAPGSPLRSLTVIRGGRTTRMRLDAPPGARQCGWKAATAAR